MGTPEFVLNLRSCIGQDTLWLISATAVVLRGPPSSAEVLLMRRSDSGEWCPISGIVEPGESPDVTARREALEETGVDVEVGLLAWVCPTPLIVHTNGDRALYLDHTFACRFSRGQAAASDDETLDAAWFPIHALPPMMPILRQRIEVVVAGGNETLVGPLELDGL